MLRTLLVAVSAAALAGCATLMDRGGATAAAPEPVPFNLAIQDVSGEATAATAPPETVAALTEAIRTAVKDPLQDGPPANLTFAISDYRVLGKGSRASRQMTVDIVVKNPAGKQLRDFTITRTATTLGTEGEKARKDSLINQTAGAVVKTLRGEK